MIRFTLLEQRGLSCAVMSDQTDGDCGIREAARFTLDTFLRRVGVDAERLVRLRQVHGCDIVCADTMTEPLNDDFPEADGVVTNRSGVALGISVADCAPVVLYEPVRHAVAALHAGREGIRQNIVAAGVQMLWETYGADPGQLLALVGPCAGPCCYEVSAELADAWAAVGLPCRDRHLYLSQAIHEQLETAGVIRHNIAVVPHCTVCGGGYHSYRADKTSNRNLVIVML